MLVNFADTVTITRYPPGDYLDGVYQYGEYTDPSDVDTWTAATDPDGPYTVYISAHIQPMNLQSKGDQDLMSFYGVQDPMGLVHILSNDEIKTADNAGKTRADTIPWNGREYDIQSVSIHPKFPPTHWQGVALLVTEKTEYP